MKIRIATRKSALALVQTKQVCGLLQQYYPQTEVELVPILTTGDKILDRPLAEIGGKGLFIKGLEVALLAGQADVAVHSLKDVPPFLDPLFCLPAMLVRQSPFDAFVSSHYESIHSLPAGATVGTCSVRRAAAILRKRPDLTIKMIRGNVDSRLKKLEAGQYDALIMAEAGLVRLGLSHYIKEILPTADFLPSVGQGAITIECLASRADLVDMLSQLNHQETFVCVTAERAMNNALKAACTSPIGSFAQVHDGVLELRGAVWSRDGVHKIETIHRGSVDEAVTIGERAALHLQQQGAAKYL
jgi:hydroxymethylbilane synthase